MRQMQEGLNLRGLDSAKLGGFAKLELARGRPSGTYFRRGAITGRIQNDCGN